MGVPGDTDRGGTGIGTVFSGASEKTVGAGKSGRGGNGSGEPGHEKKENPRRDTAVDCFWRSPAGEKSLERGG